MTIWSDSELPDNDDINPLVEQVRTSYRNSEPLRICGSKSKSFLGHPIVGSLLDVSRHTGIMSYEPSELVLTARAGTTLRQITDTLAASGQILGFEPPWFGDKATLGGTVACGLSGPRRPFSGSARDFVLGVKCITGKGELMSFGGQVIKNVAGYDVSRLMVGAMGSLGVLTEVSLRVLPRHELETTLILELDEQRALDKMIDLARLPIPISALSYSSGLMRVRLSGTENGIASATAEIGGQDDAQGQEYWLQLKEQRLRFFSRNQMLWRVSVPATAPAMNLGEDCLIDWGGALRWVYTDMTADEMFELARQMRGHATVYCAESHYQGERFSRLSGAVAELHSRLKSSFDPHRILNPGIMYRDV
ncbi:MAG: glycolate oxidase subunit GlcE [Acidiferrobacterales bacterium]|nr:glycolate oxidase subunit GlcE [Acidiferrobacterales bacterium]